jgi:WD40 repeat protein
VAIAPGGRWLAAAGDDGTVRIWDSVTGTPPHTLTGHTDSVYAVAIARTAAGWPRKSVAAPHRPRRLPTSRVGISPSQSLIDLDRP